MKETAPVEVLAALRTGEPAGRKTEMSIPTPP
ncbi:MAG: hypothetical protein THHGLFOP_001592, partial [Candidatus Fervidibacter sp.]